MNTRDSNNRNSERSWNERNERTNQNTQNQPQNRDRSQDLDRNESSSRSEQDRSREGRGNELNARTEQLSPMGAGQQTNPKGQVQDQGNENSSRRSPQNRESGDMNRRNNA